MMDACMTPSRNAILNKSSDTPLRRTRFTPDDDIVLITETVGHNPFKDYNAWKIIHENFSKTSSRQFTVRAVRERVDHLIKLHRRQDKVNLGRSGTEEQYQAKHILLDDLVSLRESFPTTIKKRQRNQGVDWRNEAARQLDTRVVISDDNCVDETFPGVNETFPRVEEISPSVEEISPSVEENSSTTSSGNLQSPQLTSEPGPSKRQRMETMTSVYLQNRLRLMEDQNKKDAEDRRLKEMELKIRAQEAENKRVKDAEDTRLKEMELKIRAQESDNVKQLTGTLLKFIEKLYENNK